MKFLLLIFCALLASCSNTQNLSIFSFNEADVETVLRQQLPDLTNNTRLLGLPVKLSVDELDVEIGPDKRDVVVLRFDSSAKIGNALLNYPVRLILAVEGSPYYDSQEKAIYLRQVSLLDSFIDAGGFRGNINSLNNELMLLINQLLASTPVYRLNTNEPKQALLSKLPIDIRVQEGAIVLVPKLSGK